MINKIILDERIIEITFQLQEECFRNLNGGKYKIKRDCKGMFRSISNYLKW